MNSWIEFLTMFCALGAATVAGTFFTFSTFAMGGLKRLEPEQGLAAMKAINEEAPRPPFMLLLFGTAIGFLLLMAASLWNSESRASTLRLLAGGLYLAGVIGMTGLYHVPRNHRLADFEPGSEAGRQYWAIYLQQWVPMNHVRTLAPLVSAGLLMLSS